jgi:hypothetical protein
MEALHARYFGERHHADTLSLGRLLEAAFTLRLAEQNRAAGNVSRASELITFAAEVCPKHKALRDFETSSSPKVWWRSVGKSVCCLRLFRPVKRAKWMRTHALS